MKQLGSVGVRFPLRHHHSRCVAVLVQPVSPVVTPCRLASALATGGAAGGGGYHRLPSLAPRFNSGTELRPRQGASGVRKLRRNFGRCAMKPNAPNCAKNITCPTNLSCLWEPSSHAKIYSAWWRFLAMQAHHPDCHLVLVGPNGWMMKGALENEVSAADLRGKVHTLGFVPQADLPGIYSLAAVFAFPSLHEGFGLPLLESDGVWHGHAYQQLLGHARGEWHGRLLGQLLSGFHCRWAKHPARLLGQREWHIGQGFAGRSPIFHGLKPLGKRPPSTNKFSPKKIEDRDRDRGNALID